MDYEFRYKEKAKEGDKWALVDQGEIQDRKYYIIDAVTHPILYIQCEQSIEWIKEHMDCPGSSDFMFYAPLPKEVIPNADDTDYLHLSFNQPTALQLHMARRVAQMIARAYQERSEDEIYAELEERLTHHFTLEEIRETVRVFILRLHAQLLF